MPQFRRISQWKFRPVINFYQFLYEIHIFSYKKKYNLPMIQTLIRGTLRYEGYAFIMRSLCCLGLFLKEELSKYLPGMKKAAWPQLIQGLLDHDKN